jgi:hypothetical protein
LVRDTVARHCVIVTLLAVGTATNCSPHPRMPLKLEEGYTGSL